MAVKDLGEPIKFTESKALPDEEVPDFFRNRKPSDEARRRYFLAIAATKPSRRQPR